MSLRGRFIRSRLDKVAKFAALVERDRKALTENAQIAREMGVPEDVNAKLFGS